MARLDPLSAAMMRIARAEIRDRAKRRLGREYIAARVNEAAQQLLAKPVDNERIRRLALQQLPAKATAGRLTPEDLQELQI